PFLNNPLMLPGEKNVPLADGTIGKDGTVVDPNQPDNGDAYFTDPNATNVNETTGQRPGFDPRMNQYPYTVEFLNGAAEGQTIDVGSVSQDILSFANSNAFPLMISGGPFTFVGTPAQSMQLGTVGALDANNHPITLNTATWTQPGPGTLTWKSVQVAITGL